MRKTLTGLILRPHQKESALIKLCEKKLHAPCRYFKILKKSLDARDKSDIRWVYSVECGTEPPASVPRVFRQVKGKPRVVIAGAGPAGLFCALRLIDHGVAPVILERGKRVEERAEDIRKFTQTGVLDPDSNVQFGEGGAGAFSDGKLNTQTNDVRNRDVLDTFVRFGAPEEVGYLGKPHVGSDNLKKVVANIRAYIQEHGGEFRFSEQLTDVRIRDGRLAEIVTTRGSEPCDELVLAVGHSARDTFEMLLSRGFVIEQKEFAVGVRMEHLQEKIGRAQYGAGYAALPPADYKLVSHASDRGVFTFCMCPGGVGIPAASEEGGVVTNGMSDYARDAVNANSALLAQVRLADFDRGHVLDGVAFQRALERAAFRAGGETYAAPVQRVEDFLCGRTSAAFGEVLPSYAAGAAMGELGAILPACVASSLRAALTDMDRRLRGFAHPDALLTGVETRFSSPVRILRGPTLESVSAAGVYPCGEGCGYSGGITSSAADGIRVAEAICAKYAAPVDPSVR